MQENRARPAHGKKDQRVAAEQDKDMYAIVRTGGKQYRVEQGQSLLVERLPVEQGASVDLEPLLWRSEETILDAEGLSAVKVTAKVLEHVRGDKLRVFKFKPKRGYKRRTGHRQELTRIEITGLSHGARASGRRASASKAPSRQTTNAPAEEAAEATRAPAAERASETKRGGGSDGA